MNFWLEAFGLGGVTIEAEYYHSAAFGIEKRLNNRLKAEGKCSTGSGTSTETFAISTGEAMSEVRNAIAIYDDQAR